LFWFRFTARLANVALVAAGDDTAQPAFTDLGEAHRRAFGTFTASTFMGSAAAAPKRGDANKQPPAAPVAPGAGDGGSDAVPMRVLLAEDNLVNQELARAMLVQMGCDVICCDNGRQVIERLPDERVHLVLMDCQMPEVDGLSATRWIRAWEASRATTDLVRHDRAPRIPIVALTANAFNEDREQCFAAGMDDFLSKPFTVDQLENLVARWRPNGASLQADGRISDRPVSA